MTRSLFLVAGGAWLVLGALGLAAALVGREWIVGSLPPLAVDADALGGALTAIAVAAAAVAAAHFVVAAGLAADVRWVRSAGMLLAATLALAFLGASAAAAASAVREAALALPLAASALLAGVVVIGYGAIVVRLIREIGAGPGI